MLPGRGEGWGGHHEAVGPQRCLEKGQWDGIHAAGTPGLSGQGDNMADTWACSKGFHAWGIVHTPSAEAEVLAGVPHPTPAHYTCINCEEIGPVIRRRSSPGKRVVRSLTARFSGRCIHCRTLVEASSAAEWSRKVREPCPNCGKPW